jgi:hypothetical protein
MNKWRKLGLLFYRPPTNRHPKLLTHFSNPLPILIHDNIYRIFYSGRDVDNRSSIGGVDIDITNGNIINEFNEPFLEYGPKNSFYESGISIGNCYKIKNNIYMLFMGWQNKKGAHWSGKIGRLLVKNDLTLSIDCNQNPIISHDIIDPISLSYPWVTENDGLYMMWYGSTISWENENDEMLHVINCATSTDGNNWKKRGLGVPFIKNKAQAFSRPTIIKNDNLEFSMWFSFRGKINEKYRIGYAHSKDGINWQLELENSGIDVSTKGWDSEMIEYPFVFNHKGNSYMLYNGNDYGKSGFGLAILEH